MKSSYVTHFVFFCGNVQLAAFTDEWHLPSADLGSPSRQILDWTLRTKVGKDFI